MKTNSIFIFAIIIAISLQANPFRGFAHKGSWPLTDTVLQATPLSKN